MKINVLLIENSGSDFYKSRSKFAIYLKENGYNVIVLIPHDGYFQKITDLGLIVFEYHLTRNKKLFSNIYQIHLVLKNLFKKHEVNIVHSFRFLPNFINVTLNLFSKRNVIIHVTGLGIAYSSENIKYKIYKKISNFVYFFLIIFSKKVIVQNHEDLNDLLFLSNMKKKFVLVKGSGVDTDYFNSIHVDISKIKVDLNIESDEIIFTCVTRLIWEKGIKELVNAFIKINKIHSKTRLLVIGDFDASNPRSVSEEFVNYANRISRINFMGNRNDVRNILAITNGFIYPSYYREGIPRSILEALSMGIPIITTNMPGCKLTVIPNSNGFLIPPKSEDSIINAIEQFILLPNQFESMKMSSRLLALNEFSNHIIYEQILQVYIDL